MLNHYKYYFDDRTLTYQFITKNAIQYSIAFIEDYALSSIANENISNVYQLVVEKVTKTKEPLDTLVAKTIEALILDFFKNIDNALIFICIDDDGKSFIRNETFKRWYFQSENKNFIQKVDSEISIAYADGGLQKIYTSIMFHIKNPNKNRLIDTFNSIQEVINTHK